MHNPHSLWITWLGPSHPQLYPSDKKGTAIGESLLGCIYLFEYVLKLQCLQLPTCVAARNASIKKTAVSAATFGRSSLCSSELTVTDKYNMNRPNRYCVGTSQDFLQRMVGGQRNYQEKTLT